MNSGLMALLSGGMQAPGLEITPPAPVGEGFQDILGLVSDMELADGQSPESQDFLEQQRSQLSLPGEQELALARNAAELQQISLVANPVQAPTETAPRKDVGQRPLASGVETLAAHEVLSSVQDLGMFADRQLASRPQSVDGEAAAVWASALASKELTAVELEAVPASPETAPSPRVAFAPAQGSALPAAAALAVRDPSTLRDLAPEAPASAPAKVEAKAERETGKAVNAAEIRSPDLANVDTRKVNEAPTVTRVSPEPAPIFEKTARESAKPEVLSGHEFLLDRMDLSTQANARGADVASMRSPALVGAAALASPESDRRISPESANFVAEKVESLRAQGGGQLRVQLDSQGMGAIEIRVSMSRGQVQVKLAAEKPETLKALQDSRSDLLGRLESSRPASLELAALGETRGQALRSVSTDSHAFTESLVDLRTASADRRASDVQATDTRDGFASGEWQRDERREQSRQRWSEAFERRSA
jgi:hypothetical protein